MTLPLPDLYVSLCFSLLHRLLDLHLPFRESAGAITRSDARSIVFSNVRGHQRRQVVKVLSELSSDRSF